MNTARICLKSLLAVAALAVFTSRVWSQGIVLTFDDLPGIGYPAVPNGYGGLQWTDVRYLDGINFWTPSGYSNAVVSPNNVAYGAAGAPSYISGASFDLISAYLTGAWNDGLQVQVQGFVNGTLIYDNTYTVVTTQPTFIVFNYLGVDEVRFDASGGVPHWLDPGTMFAMDNMSITIVPEPSSFTVIVFGIVMLMWTRRETARAGRSA